jgi:hypothetical protein
MLLKPKQQKQIKMSLSLLAKSKPLKKQRKPQSKEHKNQLPEPRVSKKQHLYLLRRLPSQLSLLNKPEVHQFKLKNLLNKQKNLPKKHKPPSVHTKVLDLNHLLH